MCDLPKLILPLSVTVVKTVTDIHIFSLPEFATQQPQSLTSDVTY